MRTTIVNVVPSRRSAAYPLGAVSIAAALRRRGLAVDVRDYLLWPGPLLDEENFTRFLEGSGELVWLCCGADALPFLVLSLERATRAYPEKRFVLSERMPPLPKAAGPSDVAQELLEHFPFISAVAVGECDETAVECASHFPHFAGVAGLVWRNNGRVQTNPPRPRLAVAPEIEREDYALLDFQPYRDLRDEHGEELPRVVAASRGCVYRCAFCSVSLMWQHQQVRRPVTAVVEELASLAERTGQRRFTFIDETFILDRAWVLAFAEALRERRLNLRWACTGRVDLMDEESMVAMRAAGCERVELGIESGCDQVLEQVEKGFSAEDALRVVRRASSLFPSVYCNFIWGFPFESTEGLGRTLLVMQALARYPGVGVKLFFLLPLRPSRLFDLYQDRLRYDPFWHRCAPRLPLVEPMLHLVQEHPRVFSGFCYYDHPQLADKLEMLGHWGFGPEVTTNGLSLSWSG